MINAIMEDFFRIVLIPILIMIGGFVLELLAIRVRGVRQGVLKFKLWFRRADESLHSDYPYSLQHVIQWIRGRSQHTEHLVDIVQLASFEDYAGISFDLIMSAFTADIVVLLNQHKIAQVASRAAGTIAFHFLFLTWIVVLVAANQRMRPDESEALAKFRTMLAVLLGLVALVTGFITLWEAL